jgi:hypothetical protein
MKCNACGYPNADGLRVCGACLAPLGGGGAAAPGSTPVPPGGGTPPGPIASPVPPVDTLRKRVADDLDPGLVPAEVLDLYEKGRGVDAHAALRRRLGEDASRRAARQALLDDLRLWAQPATGAPGMFTLNGVGTRPSGVEDMRPDGSFILTNWFVVLFVPVWPLGAYLVRPGRGGWRQSWYFLARVPVSEASRQWGWRALAVLGLLAAAFAAFVIVDP